MNHLYEEDGVIGNLVEFNNLISFFFNNFIIPGFIQSVFLLHEEVMSQNEASLKVALPGEIYAICWSHLIIHWIMSEK